MSSTVGLIADGTALLSLRKSDFDAYGAIGEVVDNSSQAESENLKIPIDYFPASREEAVSKIAFGDDGTGMLKDILHRCLQLGYSTRFNCTTS